MAEALSQIESELQRLNGAPAPDEKPGGVEHCDHIIVAVEVNAWPFPWGSLRWLFKVAGASTLEPEPADGIEHSSQT